MAVSVRIILENIRSFEGRHNVELKPLTLLVGENSAGKSTFMAAASCALTSELFPSPKGFNIPPYDLGSYDSIATYRGGKAGRKKYFSLGIENNPEAPNKETHSFCVQYQSRNGRAVGTKFNISSPQGKAEFEFSATGSKLKLRDVENSPDLEIEIKSDESPEELTPQKILAYALRNLVGSGQDLKELNIAAMIDLLNFGETYRHVGCSIAPIRTKPKRTYDATLDQFEPEGDHIPYLLAKLMREEVASSRATYLVETLNAFGLESGLFNTVGIKSLGSKAGSPFQLQVNLEGPPKNITDVGYGVSQSLPIVVQLALLKHERFAFIQQPEVHLHPRAQAALGTFLSKLCSQSNERNYVVETHSDYLMDRIRLEISKGTLKPSQVQILFFELVHQKTKIHPITLDSIGNLVEPPPSYRAFFLRERRQQLNRAENVPDHRQ